MSAWRGVFAGVLVLVLAGGLLWAINGPFSDSSAAPPTLASRANTTEVTDVPATVTIPTSIAVSTTTSEPPSIVTTAVPAAPDFVVAMQEALSAWGEFAVTGRMSDLGDWFVVGGPQRRLLREESAAIQENAPGEPAYEVTTADIFTISVTTDDVVLRAEVLWARDGEETQEFVWDIQMRRADGQWRLLTVEAVPVE